MKLLFVFALLALVCMARSAPAPSTTPRKLILPDYHDNDEDTEHDGTHIDEEEEEYKPTTTTTTTRRSTYAVPTRNRNLIPSRRPSLTERTTSARTRTTTTTVADDADVEGNGEYGHEYEGDFKYIKDFRKYIQKLLEDIRKLVQNLTGYNLNHYQQQGNQQYNRYDDDE